MKTEKLKNESLKGDDFRSRNEMQKPIFASSICQRVNDSLCILHVLDLEKKCFHKSVCFR